MFKQTARSLALAALAVLTTSLAAPAAWAGDWIGSWDPPYGTPFTDLGWRGFAKFNIPLSPPCATDGAACVPGSSVTLAQVIFYDTGTNIDIAEINWNATELSGVAINALAFVAGEVKHFDTGLFPGKLPTLYPGVDGVDYGNFDIAKFFPQFVIDQSIGFIDDVEQFFSGPRLYWELADCGPDCPGGGNDALAFPPANFKVVLVPEPASLALLTVALLAAGAAARRRQPRA